MIVDTGAGKGRGHEKSDIQTVPAPQLIFGEDKALRVGIVRPLKPADVLVEKTNGIIEEQHKPPCRRAAG